jgi:hypothetical protein
MNEVTGSQRDKSFLEAHLADSSNSCCWFTVDVSTSEPSAVGLADNNRRRVHCGVTHIWANH